jgi:hypothetical protein
MFKLYAVGSMPASSVGGSAQIARPSWVPGIFTAVYSECIVSVVYSECSVQ